MTGSEPLARATEAYVNDRWPHVDDETHAELLAEMRASARAVVSAALHDPDDSDWLADVIDDAGDEWDSVVDHVGGRSLFIAAAVRAAILVSEVSRG